MWIEVTAVNKADPFMLNIDQVCTCQYDLIFDRTHISLSNGQTYFIKGWLRELSNGLWRVDVRDK